jgi:hypothetical protein
MVCVSTTGVRKKHFPSFRTSLRGEISISHSLRLLLGSRSDGFKTLIFSFSCGQVFPPDREAASSVRSLKVGLRAATTDVKSMAAIRTQKMLIVVNLQLSNCRVETPASTGKQKLPLCMSTHTTGASNTKHLF